MRIGREVGGVHWLYLKAQGMAESNLDPNAVSRAGAQGLMQFMPPTWMEWGRGNPFDPEESIRAGARYMKWLLSTQTVDGDLRKAWAAYNWGIGNLGKAIRAHGDKWERALPRETSDYIARITRFIEELTSDDSS
jgi:soluble lytic murein transglycosylase-like protein